MERVGLHDRADDLVSTYSLGMRQRLGLARAILGDPRLLILDEPTNGMDPRGMKDVRELLVKMAAQGTTVFISSHLLAEVAQLCSRVGILDRGVLVHESTVDAGLEDTYLSMTRGGIG
jgi:ABC-2 type transport system ATP-binding protein